MNPDMCGSMRGSAMAKSRRVGGLTAWRFASWQVGNASPHVGVASEVGVALFIDELFNNGNVVGVGIKVSYHDKR